jgi:hypothetical protein
MDIANLRLHLKDEYTYEDTTKEIFLNEIERIFEEHQNLGDTELLIYKGACAGKICENWGCKGFRFLGNHSKNFMDLLFDIEGDDIKDISNCPVFDTDVEINDLGRQACFYINPDDLTSFIKTPEYWTKVNSALAAFNEIVTNPPKPVTFEDLSNWLDKHADTDVLIGSYVDFKPKMKWTPFSNLYFDFKKIKTYISVYFDEIEKAHSSINQNFTDEELIEWIFKNEPLYKAFPDAWSFSFEKDSNNYITDQKEKIIFAGYHLGKTFKFYRFYCETDFALMAKYNTYTEEEECKLYETVDCENFIFSLQFHLEKRKAMEVIGIQIPLYVNSGYEMK